MKWSLSQLQKYKSKGFPIDEIVHVDNIKKLDPSIRDVSPIQVFGHAYIDSSKVTFELNLKGHFILPCSRTLVDVNYPIDVKTTETFLIKGYDYEGEEEIHEIKGEVIDLMPIIKEILLLEVPMQVFSEDTLREDGAPQSGNGWQVIEEVEEKGEKIDPRLSKLAQLLNQNDASSNS